MIEFAKQTENIDLILGGHTHTFLDAPEMYKNKPGSDVLDKSGGFWGYYCLVGLTFRLEKRQKKNLVKSPYLW